MANSIADALLAAVTDTESRVAWLLQLHDDRDVLRHGPTEPLSYDDTAQSFVRLLWDGVFHGSVAFPDQFLDPASN